MAAGEWSRHMTARFPGGRASRSASSDTRRYFEHIFILALRFFLLSWGRAGHSATAASACHVAKYAVICIKSAWSCFPIFI
jgi:hypothetical protein